MCSLQRRSVASTPVRFEASTALNRFTDTLRGSNVAFKAPLQRRFGVRWASYGFHRRLLILFHYGALFLSPLLSLRLLPPLLRSDLRNPPTRSSLFRILYCLFSTVSLYDSCLSHVLVIRKRAKDPLPPLFLSFCISFIRCINHIVSAAAY